VEPFDRARGPEFIEGLRDAGWVNFIISTSITTDNQQFAKIEGRAIFRSPGMAGSAEVLWRTQTVTKLETVDAWMQPRG
jgi:hypothetical protein